MLKLCRQWGKRDGNHAQEKKPQECGSQDGWQEGRSPGVSDCKTEAVRRVFPQEQSAKGRQNQEGA